MDNKTKALEETNRKVDEMTDTEPRGQSTGNYESTNSTAEETRDAIDKSIDAQKEHTLYLKKLKLLTIWLTGTSTHITIDGLRHCCPDMSCCCPTLLAPKPFRRAYLQAHVAGCDVTKVDLSNTFTLYFAEANGFSTSLDAKMYSDWVKETDLFGWVDRLVIWHHFKKFKIKY